MQSVCVRLAVGLSCLCLLRPSPAAAERPTGAIAGVAVAADGARLPGVRLQVVNEESGRTFEAVTGEAGLFRVGDLPPGRYRIAAELSGFEPYRSSGVSVGPGASTVLDLRLEIATVRETVAVVGERRRDTVEVLAMRESRARDVGEALVALPGVWRLRKGGIANDVVLRGFQGKDVTMLIDGLRIDGACPGHMDPPAFHVDFAEVSRAEVSRGPFDVKNQGGLAGVVNVVTERPTRGAHGSAHVGLASAQSIVGSAAVSVGRARWAALAGGSRRRADPYRDGRGTPMTARSGYRTDAVRDAPAYDVWTAWGRVALVPAENASLQISYARQSAGTVLYPYLMMDALSDDADRAGVRFEAKLPGGQRTLAAHGYFTRVDHWMTDQFRASGAGRPRGFSMGTRAQTRTAGGRAEFGAGAFTAGVEVSRRNWITESVMAMSGYVPSVAMPDVTIAVGGAFATYSRDLTPRWRLETGARLDHATSAASPALANTALYAAYHDTRRTQASDTLPAGYVRARWRAGGWSAVGGVGRSVRLPDQQERFYAVARMGADWVGNPALSPTRNTGFDGELRYRAGGAEFLVAGFAYRVDDFIRVGDQQRIAMVPGVMNTVARTFVNLDAFTRGVEAAATVPIAPSLSLASDLALVRGTVRGASRFDGDLPEMPPARLRVRLRLDRARWSMAAEAVAASRQDHVAEDLRETPTSGYAVINAVGTWRVGVATILVAADNLFDSFYSEHLSYQRDPFRNGVRVYEPGRTGSISLSFRF